MRQTNRRSRFIRSLRLAVLSLTCLSLITCGEDPVGPGANAGSFTVRPVLPPYARVAPLVIDRVAIFVSRFVPPESTELIFSDTIAFSPNSNTLRLSNIRIPMDNPTEDVELRMELLAGNTILFTGFDDFTLVRGASVQSVDVPLGYSGPGSNVTSLQLAPQDTVLQPGQTVDYVLDAFDVQGAEVPEYYAGWSLSSGAASSAKINAVGHLTASAVNDTFYVVVATPNGVLDSARVIVGSGTAPSATLTWTGAASTDFSAAANWSPAQVPSFNDSIVIGAAASQRQPSLTAQTIVGAVSIVNGGSLTINGLAIVISRGLSTSGDGVLNMTFPEDIVSVLGDAVFDGGNELNLMTDGGLSVAGNLTQRATNSGDSFHPSGNHTTILTGATPTLSFATPGLVPGTSHFQRLGWIGTGTLTLATQVMAHDELVVSGTGASIISSSNGSRLTVSTVASVGQLAFNNVPLTLSQTAPNSMGLLNITFQNMLTNVSQLVVSHPGGSFDFDNITFQTTPVAPNGLYLDVIDINSQTDGFLTINMNTPTPASGGAFVKTAGGAVVNWPASTSTARIWTGATSNDWSTGTNWSGGVVPGATDSAVIVAATNAPQVNSSVTVGALNVASGNLSIGDAGITVARGFSTTGTGTLTMTSGSGLDVAGSVVFAGGSTAGLLPDGVITVGGNFTQIGGTSPQSFAADAANRVIMNAPQPNIAFSNPGGTASHFGTFQQGQTATGFTMATNMTIIGNLDGPDGFSGEFFGSGVTLTLGGGTGCCVDLNGVVLVIDDPTGNVNGISGVSFTNIPTTATQLTIRSPGNGLVGLDLSSINWRTLPAGSTGSYLDVTDVNGATGGTLAVTVSSNDPGNGPSFTKTGGGALVFWPGSQATWTGAVSTDWGLPGNWNNLRVPFQNSLLIPAGTPNAPVVSAPVPAVGDLTVAAGQTVTIQTGQTLGTIGNATITGNITTAGSGLFTLQGTGKTVSGNVGNLDVQGSYSLAGRVALPAGGSVTISSGSLALAGHTLATGTLTTNTTSATLTMTNPLDSLLVSGTANIGGADETGQLTAGVMALGGDLLISPFIPLAFVPSGTHKVLLNGSGTQQLSFPAGTSSRFQNLQIAIGGGLSAALNGSTVNVAGSLSITSGQLAMNGRRVNVGGNFSTGGTGVLNMNNAGDSLFITGNATFAGGSTFGTLGNGVLSIGGEFTQSAVTSVASFAPNGLHKTILGSPFVLDITMGSPGAAGAGSHFQVLDVTPATGGLFLNVNMQADSLISTAAAAEIQSLGSTFTARRVQVTGLTLSNTRFVLDEQGSAMTENFSNVTFNGYPANSTGLVLFTVIGPGSSLAARPAVTTNNVNFTPQLGVGAANFYVDLTTSNGASFNMVMTGSNQGATAGGNGQALTRVTPATGVATVSWP